MAGLGGPTRGTHSTGRASGLNVPKGIGVVTFASTGVDAPRRTSIEDADTESLDAIKTKRAEAQSPDVDLDEGDAGESIELPGADLSGEELIMAVIPKQADEFTCTSCFLVQHRSRIASGNSERAICIDCA